jgi:hypothetical protein
MLLKFLYLNYISKYIMTYNLKTYFNLVYHNFLLIYIQELLLQEHNKTLDLSKEEDKDLYEKILQNKKDNKKLSDSIDEIIFKMINDSHNKYILYKDWLNINKEKVKNKFIIFTNKDTIDNKNYDKFDEFNDNECGKKPKGLWFGYGSDWLNYNLHYNLKDVGSLFIFNYNCCIEIEINISDKILFVESYQQLFDLGLLIDDTDHISENPKKCPNWEKIHRDYDGMVIISDDIELLERDENGYIIDEKMADKYKPGKNLYNIFTRWSIKSGVLWKNLDKHIKYYRIIGYYNKEKNVFETFIFSDITDKIVISDYKKKIKLKQFIFEFEEKNKLIKYVNSH